MTRNILYAGLAAISISTAMPRPAEAWGGGSFVFGTAVGLGVGAVVGTAMARPYAYGYFPYGYYPYRYYPSVYPYAVPYGYAYPPPPVGYAAPPVAYAPPGYPVPLSPRPSSANQPASYAQTRPAQGPATQTSVCRSGQFFNNLTGTCDRR